MISTRRWLHGLIAETTFGYILCVVLGAAVCALGTWVAR